MSACVHSVVNKEKVKWLNGSLHLIIFDCTSCIVVLQVIVLTWKLRWKPACHSVRSVQLNALTIIQGNMFAFSGNGWATHLKWENHTPI